jgi:hypothetical protein
MANRKLQRTALEALPTERLVKLHFDFVIDSIGDPNVPSRAKAINALLAEVKKGPAWFIDYMTNSTVAELRAVVAALGGIAAREKKKMVAEIDRLVG